MSECRSCGAPITWTKNANGAWVPINAAGFSHFIDCPKAASHKGTGKRPTKPKPAPAVQETLFDMGPGDK